MSNTIVTDLDSICSALLYAYFRTYNNNNNTTPPHTLHIPLSNLPRGDLALRPELGAVLSPAGLQLDDLLTLSDLPSSDALNDASSRWLLVDHNALTGDLKSRFGNNNIIGCVDHHDDEGVVPKDTKDEPRVIEKAGSCMSLVVDQCKGAWEKLSQQQPEESQDRDGNAIDRELAHVALAPILIDTTNLTSKDKTTDWDVRAVDFVTSKLTTNNNNPPPNISSSSPSHEEIRTSYFTQITNLKEQISGMSYRDILRKDYKRWSDATSPSASTSSPKKEISLGISSVVQSISYLLSEIGPKPQFLSALRDWAKEQDLDIAAVMTVSRPDGKFTRELLVWAFNEEAVEAAKRFASRHGEALGLEQWKGGELDGEEADGGWRACWEQGRVENSRKQVAPMLREVIRDLAKL